MAKPSLLEKDIWGNHEKRVLELFSRALKLLQESTDLPYKEDDLSRQLFMLVRRLKRLGSPSSSQWILNKNYILNGINRFILVEWGYGKSVSSGAMIGYIQNMELKEILNKVNKHCSQLTIIELTLSPEGWQNDVSRLDHQLERPDVPPSPFNLRHLWVDLRSKKTDNNDDTSS